MSLSVALPKQVLIKNTRLATFHILASILMSGCFTMYKFWIERGATIKINVKTQLKVAIEESSHESMEAMNLSNYEDIGCEQKYIGRNKLTSAGKWVKYPSDRKSVYTYDWPDENISAYGNSWKSYVTCMHLCTFSDHLNMTTKGGCLSELLMTSIGERWMFTSEQLLIQSSSTSVAIVTARRDLRFLWPKKDPPRREAFIMPAPYAMHAKLKFTYMVRRLEEVPWFFWTNQEQSPGSLQNTDVTTVVLDNAGLPFKVIPRGEQILILLEEAWLAAAGHPSNRTILAAGAELDASVDCYGTPRDAANALKLRAGRHVETSWSFDIRHDSPVCFLSFNLIYSEYIVERSFYDKDRYGGWIAQLVGIRIETKSGTGFVRFYDLGSIVLQLTSIVVLAAIPVHVTIFIAKYMLGELSRMYNGVMVEPFDMQELILASSMLLMSSASIFSQLSGQSCNTKAEISKEQMVTSFEAAFMGNDFLDQAESRRMADYAYSLIVRMQDERTENLGCFEAVLRDLCDIRIKHSKAYIQRDIPITLDMFLRARMKSEKLNLDVISRLFDVDRKRPFLERAFTPVRLRKLLASKEKVELHRRQLEEMTNEEIYEPQSTPADAKEMEPGFRKFQEQQDDGSLGNSRLEAMIVEIEAIKVRMQTEQQLRLTLEAHVERLSEELRQHFLQLNRNTRDHAFAPLASQMVDTNQTLIDGNHLGAQCAVVGKQKFDAPQHLPATRMDHHVVTSNDTRTRSRRLLEKLEPLDIVTTSDGDFLPQVKESLRQNCLAIRGEILEAVDAQMSAHLQQIMTVVEKSCKNYGTVSGGRLLTL